MEEVQKPEILPKLKKVELKPKEEPKKAEEKKTKPKVSKAKKFEELPEIPDYERPVLEVYEQSEFDPNKPEKKVSTPLVQSQQATSKQAEESQPEPKKLEKPQVILFVVKLFTKHEKYKINFF